MKPLTCEMCGSNNLIKQEGVFVCQSCGTKYSVEEARKMMIEGTVTVDGTVRVDDSEKNKKLINNYLEMAKSALAGSDDEGAIVYSNKVLEIDTENYEAWVIKAKIAGSGSSLNNIKIPQAITAAKRAISLAPEFKRYEIAESLYLHNELIILSLINIAKTMPIAYSSTQIHKVIQCWLNLLLEIPYLRADVIDGAINRCGVLCSNSANAVLPADRTTYAAYVAHNKRVRYDVTFRQALSQKREFELSREAQLREKLIESIKAYWKSHPDEFNMLNKKKADAEQKKKELFEERQRIPELPQAQNLKSQIDSLVKQKNALGMFKTKEKQELQLKIDALNKEFEPLRAIVDKKWNDIQLQVDEQDKIISEVMNTLNNKYC